MSLVHALSAVVGASDTASDGELLRRFAESGDRSAFELVVRRHAELVWGVCRAALARDRHAAEDAFQATFLILARKAATLRDASAAGWLFRVARNAAVRARGRGALRSTLPLTAVLAVGGEPADETAARREAAPIVAEEIARLASRLREPVVLCFFEGHTHAEAAARLGWPIGTVASRLARAKDVLRDRLTRRGVVLSAGGLAAVFPVAPAAAAPLLRSTVAAAVGSADRVPPAVISLTEGVLSAMRFAQIKSLAACCLVAIGLTAALATASRDSSPEPARSASSGAALVLSPAAPVTIYAAPVDDDKAAKEQAARVKELEAKELKALQGKWRVVKLESNGMQVPPEELVKRRIDIEDDVVHDPRGTDPQKLKIKLAPSKSPKAIDFTPLDGPNKGKSVPCIYKLEDDTLTLCLPIAAEGAARPKEFKAAEGVSLIVLERIKDEKEELAALAGEWTAKTVLAAGKDDPAGQVGKTKWIFEGAKITMLEPNARSPIMGLKLDPAAIPPAIDFMTTDGKEAKLKGVYFRQKDKLIVSIRVPNLAKTDRPGNLKPADDVTFMVLERNANPGIPIRP